MKKKGLIVATIVMVLVLAVSLTTATYAWFTASSNTKVDTLSLEVKSASAVAIGARVGTGTSQDDYRYDAVTLGYNTTSGSENLPTYTSDNVGLGTSLSFTGQQGTLTLSKAVNTATSIVPGTSVTGASAVGAFNPQGKVIYAASSGASDTVIDNSSIAYAKANTDFVVLNMGAQASQDIYGIYATIKVSTTDSATTLKMMAAMHFFIRVYDSAAVDGDDVDNDPDHYSISTTNYHYKEFDLFGSATQNTAKSSAALSGLTPPTGVSYALEDSQATATFSFLIGGVGNYTDGDIKLAQDGSEIFMFDIYAYILGTDTNCVSAATGAAAAFDIQFFGITSQQTSAPVTYMALSETYSA